MSLKNTTKLHGLAQANKIMKKEWCVGTQQFLTAEYD